MNLNKHQLMTVIQTADNRTHMGLEQFKNILLRCLDAGLSVTCQDNWESLTAQIANSQNTIVCHYEITGRLTLEYPLFEKPHLVSFPYAEQLINKYLNVST
jgi:3-methyladenine DNA glycosylase/8-oxoguanine DNA glycosylase